MLNLYLSLALMTLKLWELSGLIGYASIIRPSNINVILTYFVTFKIWEVIMMQLLCVLDYWSWSRATYCHSYYDCS